MTEFDLFFELTGPDGDVLVGNARIPPACSRLLRPGARSKSDLGSVWLCSPSALVRTGVAGCCCGSRLEADADDVDMLEDVAEAEEVASGSWILVIRSSSASASESGSMLKCVAHSGARISRTVPVRASYCSSPSPVDSSTSRENSRRSVRVPPVVSSGQRYTYTVFW